MSVLGNKIKKERENLNMTREDLAKKVGVSYSAIAMYEQGNREPNNDLLIKMCELFRCTSDYLLGITRYKNPKEDIEKQLYDLNLTEKEFDDVINLLTDNNRVNFLFDLIRNTDPKMKKIVTAYKICLSICWDYSMLALDDISNYDEIKNVNDSPHMRKALDVIYRLDKNKIIHNYKDKDEQDFRFAYHKDMEGLTEEEISDALRFYKEMKKRVENDKK